MADITAVSLFAGIGGFDEALRRAGARVVAAVEIDPACRGVLARHFPGVKLFDDVRTVTGDQLRAAGFDPVRGIMAGGWPCTGNSSAGRRRGMADPRSGLWLHFARLLGELHPAWILAENVPGLYTVNGGADIAVVRGDLAHCGYWWAERILDAQHFGLAQRRPRVIFAGCLGDRQGPVQVLFDGEGRGGDSAPGSQARPGDPGAAAVGAGTVGALGTTGPGGGWPRTLSPRRGTGCPAGGVVTPARGLSIAETDVAAAVDGAGGSTCVVVSALQGGGRRGFRVDAEGAAGGQLVTAPLAATLTSGSSATPGVNPPGLRREDDVNLVANGVGVRRLTPLERERLQGFPDNWTRWRVERGRVVEQSDSARDRQTGNAVPLPVAEWVARRSVAWLRDRPPVTPGPAPSSRPAVLSVPAGTVWAQEALFGEENQDG